MKPHLKILHITGSMSIGGAERLVLGLVQHTDKTAFEVHVYSFGKLKAVSFLPEFQALADIQLTVDPKQSFYDPRDLFRIADYIREHQIDIIQTHMLDADIIGRSAARLAGVPVISTLQNEPQEYDNARFDRRWLARWTARNFATHAIAVSHHIRNLFIRDWHLPANQVGVIYNAVNMAEYLSIPAGTPQLDPKAGLTITNIASLSPQKAQHILLEAARIVLERHPTTRFMIVGQGNLEEKLKTQAIELGIHDQVIFTGVRRDIPEILAQSDIFTLSSFWEGLPLSAVEAMAAARPVVLTNVGGNQELVESGKDGLIVPPRDPSALAEAFLRLIADRPMRLQIGQAAREKVRVPFHIQTIANQYQAVYRDVWQKFHQPGAEV